MIYKVSKEVNANEYIELGSFDATKYGKIRIFATQITRSGLNGPPFVTKAFAQKEGLDYAVEVLVVGVADGVEVPLFHYNESVAQNNYAPVIDVPPTMIRIKVKGKGTVSFYAWGQ